MLKPWQQNTIIIVLLLGVLLVGWRILSSPYPYPEINYSPGSDTTPETRQDIAAEATAYYTKLLAWFTGGLAVFTIGLWSAALYQAGDTHRALNLAREEFIASHRPLLIVRNIYLLPVQDGRHSASVRFSIHNVGSSAANVTEFIFWAIGENWKEKVFPLFTLEGPNLPLKMTVGEDVQWYAIPSRELPEFIASDANLLSGVMGHEETSLKFRVRVIYEDSFGAKRTTSAVRRYDFTDSVFRRIENDEHEYQD